MFEDMPQCRKCGSTMVQLPGFLTFYCPYCSSKKEVIDMIRRENPDDKEITDILDDLERGV